MHEETCLEDILGPLHFSLCYTEAQAHPGRGGERKDGRPAKGEPCSLQSDMYSYVVLLSHALACTVKVKTSRERGGGGGRESCLVKAERMKPHACVDSARATVTTYHSF